MAAPNPLAQQPVKGAKTTFWIYNGQGDPYASALDDTAWTRTAKIKSLQPGELTADSYEDTYLDDEDADWKSTSQGEKSAGETTVTLAWKPGETGQQALVTLFNSGDKKAYRIKYPNGTVDIFRGWISSLGKAVTVNEVITRTVKFTNVGKPSLAEETQDPPVAVSGLTLTPAAGKTAVGASVSFDIGALPAEAVCPDTVVGNPDETFATVSRSGNTVTATGVKAGTLNIPVISSDGSHMAMFSLTVTA